MTAIALPEQSFTIAEVADRTGISAHTLRYYERIGLLNVGRHPSGRRRFTDHNIGRVAFIGCLRATALPIREIQRYFTLVAGGPATEDDRLALLLAHRNAVRDRLLELEAALDAVEYKIARYRGSGVPGPPDRRTPDHLTPDHLTPDHLAPRAVLPSAHPDPDRQPARTSAVSPWPTRTSTGSRPGRRPTPLASDPPRSLGEARSSETAASIEIAVTRSEPAHRVSVRCTWRG